MKKKGRLLVESPEKMPVITCGIEMTRGARQQENPNAQEFLTGGQGVADESRVQGLVMRFLKRMQAE